MTDKKYITPPTLKYLSAEKVKLELPWSCTVEKIECGYLVSYIKLFEDSDDRGRIVNVPVVPGEFGDEKDAAVNMCREVLDHFGEYDGIEVRLKPEEEPFSVEKTRKKIQALEREIRDHKRWVAREKKAKRNAKKEATAKRTKKRDVGKSGPGDK